MVKVKQKCPECDGNGYTVVPSRKNPNLPEQAQCARCYAEGYLEDVINLSQEEVDVLSKYHFDIVQKEGFVKAFKTLPEGYSLELFIQPHRILTQIWTLKEDQPEISDSFAELEDAINWFKTTLGPIRI